MCSSPTPGHPARVPRLALIRQVEGVLLCPPTGIQPPIPMVVMPKVPGTLINWLMLAAEAFYEDHHRHLAFLLLYCPSAGHWDLQLPSQSCRSDGVSWSLCAQSLPSWPQGYFFVGSFQSCPDTDDALAAVPPLAGLHFIFHPCNSDRPLRAVLRCDQPDRADLILPEAVITRDHEAFLWMHQRRLELV